MVSNGGNIMLIVISPAKTLDFVQPHLAWSQPVLSRQSDDLLSLLQAKSRPELALLMKLSDKLADLNYQRYQMWDTQPVKAAVHAFKGDVYRGLQADQWGADTQKRAQKHMRILSGLYGVLRPYDEIKPYRLEMGTKLANDKGDHLYKFWGSLPTEKIQAALKDSIVDSNSEPVLINLASQEYFKVLKTSSLASSIVTPIFKDEKNGKYKIISFYAKYARGLMLNYLVQDARFTLESLLQFKAEGYVYDPKESSELSPVFKRS